jgi:hypothetical protein
MNASTTPAFKAEPTRADGPVVVEAAVVVGPQQWQSHQAEQQNQQKQLSAPPALFQPHFQLQQQQQHEQQHSPERDQAAGDLARFFKTAGQQHRVWGQDFSSAASVTSLHPSMSAAVPVSSAADFRATTAAPPYTRLQPAALPMPQDVQDVWGARGAVWGGLGDLGAPSNGSNGSSGSGKGGMMFVGDKQVESRPPAEDALWTGFGSGAGTVSRLNSRVFCLFLNIRGAQLRADIIASDFDFLGDIVGAGGGRTAAFDVRAVEAESASRFQVKM